MFEDSTYEILAEKKLIETSLIKTVISDINHYVSDS